MSHADNRLPIPPAAAADPRSMEMIRAWITDSGLHCSLQMGLWEDENMGGWGILLADIVRQVASARQEKAGVGQAQTIAEIRHIFDAELDPPTD